MTPKDIEHQRQIREVQGAMLDHLTKLYEQLDVLFASCFIGSGEIEVKIEIVTPHRLIHFGFKKFENEHKLYYRLDGDEPKQITPVSKGTTAIRIVLATGGHIERLWTKLQSVTQEMMNGQSEAIKKLESFLAAKAESEAER